MIGQHNSLRALVGDWFGKGGQLRVSRAGRTTKMPWRAVQVEVARASGTFAIVFFRHDDGSWCVYPPPVVRPVLNWLCN